MIGYFQALAEWKRKRSDALKAVRDAYQASQPKAWQFLLCRKAREKIYESTEERLRMAIEQLSETEHTKPERPDNTVELFRHDKREE